MGRYTKWIEDNHKSLYVATDELGIWIRELNLFYLELSLEAASIYLDRRAADGLPEVRRCFVKYGLEEGIEWIRYLEEAYGMPIHPNQSDREYYIFESEGCEEVQERLDAHGKGDRARLEVLLPKVDILLDQLVEERRKDVSRLLEAVAALPKDVDKA